MAFKRLKIDGNGQVELNNVAFRRDGRVEAQCKLNETEFAEKGAENGMVLAVDNTNRTLNLPKEGDPLLVLIYSSEHMDIDKANGLKDFINTVDGFYPRGGYLAKGDKFTTNTIGYDDTDFADDEALLGDIKDDSKKIYGKVGAEGVITLTATKPADGLAFIANKVYTVPNGTVGIQLQVIAD
jgi:hypothetical protein